MIEIFKSKSTKDGKRLEQIESFRPNSWINITNPSEVEINTICAHFTKLDAEDIQSVLDREELSRIEVNRDYVMLLVDIPVSEDYLLDIYTTIPLGIILYKEYIFTICSQKTPLMHDFKVEKIHDVDIEDKIDFMLKILDSSAKYYHRFIGNMNKKLKNIESALQKSMNNRELVRLSTLERSLIYFITALKRNESILENLAKKMEFTEHGQYMEALEDIIIENKQAKEMVDLYHRIINNSMEFFSSILSNNLNVVMKFLTAVTTIMAIPTIVSGIYGMNVDLPFENNHYAFIFVMLVIVVSAILLAYYMIKKDMF